MRNKTSKSGDSLLDTYFKQIKVFPLLTFDEELELSRQVQEGSEDAAQKLVNSNLRLVVKIAAMYHSRDVSLMDIIQEGNIGLMHAAKKYDYRKNVRFCTYACWWIRQFISRYISNSKHLIRLPQRKEETLRKIRHTYHLLSQSMMHQPKSADIAKELGISVQDVDSYFNIASESLPYEYAADDTASSVDLHEDYTYCPERDFMKKASRDNTLRLLNKLMDREKRIISYRYQLNGCEYFTLREIGVKMNISPETVRQIERRALRKIRCHADDLKEYLYVEAI
ncbi:MAG: RNA polymerase sigma factor RpoD/SigA [Treponema sp.]|nr:RNA polymerase sigma factor RpoD/SigA [Treponema sp.]